MHFLSLRYHVDRIPFWVIDPCAPQHPDEVVRLADRHRPLHEQKGVRLVAVVDPEHQLGACLFPIRIEAVMRLRRGNAREAEQQPPRGASTCSGVPVVGTRNVSLNPRCSV